MRNIIGIKRFFFWMALLSCLSGHAQTKVTIDYRIQRFLGNVSELDRTKYFNYHGLGNDDDYRIFKSDFDASDGRGFWAPYSFAKSSTGEIGKYPAPKSGSSEIRKVNRFVATEHPRNVVRYNLSKESAADWAVEYFLNYTDDSNRPEIFEPMNEPFVHADDDVFTAEQPDSEKMRERMAEWFGAIGKKIHATPELANMKVIGYSSAWPSVELWDFGHWDTRMKMFMDIAGEDMDGFATHLYDGVNVTGQNNRRSGSNAAAILDLIENYSYIKWKEVKPHAITEYGAIESGYDPGFNPAKSIQSVKSINHMLFDLLEREDRMMISIPFITGKAIWHINEANDYQYYTPSLWRPTKVTPTADPNKPKIEGWQYTPRIHFYHQWKDVKGKRVFVYSHHPDIQAQAFVASNQLYLALSNLDDNNKSLSLDFVNSLDGLQSLRVKALKVYAREDPVYTDEISTSAPSTVTLIGGETVVMEYTFDKDIDFNNQIRTANYYTENYLEDILSNREILYSFKGVDIGSSIAKLKMSIGRTHDRSKRPLIKINGTPIHVPGNWKGYDQANRDEFFGTIDIPFSGKLLKEDNTVSITFPDRGGKISSLILSVDKFEMPEPDLELIAEAVLGVAEEKSMEVTAFPNPSRSQISIQSKYQIKDILLLDTMGRSLWRKDNVRATTFTINMDNLVHGKVYFIQLGTTKGYFMEKIVLE